MGMQCVNVSMTVFICLYLRMYVCTYVCMYVSVCLSACMYACMYVFPVCTPCMFLIDMLQYVDALLSSPDASLELSPHVLSWKLASLAFKQKWSDLIFSDVVAQVHLHVVFRYVLVCDVI